ncbi:protein kinase [Rhodococcus erythropolis]|nr:protein kinase [Rhodococcus erythropolis]
MVDMDDPLETQREARLPLPSELDTTQFEDIHEIGRGGFGVVYRCKQVNLDRVVAVKVLTNLPDRERFLREQRAMGKMTGHPDIVNLFEVGITGSGRPYIVMQYYPKDSLESRIRKIGPLTLKDSLHLGVKMAGALATVHYLGVLHRDVKPANILLTDYGEPQLTDFGIAHIPDGFKTSAGTVTASPAYTAPEVLAGNASTLAADVYGLGATLFAAMTGHAAFERRSGEHLIAQFLRITSESVPDLQLLGVPRDVSTIIEHAMARGDKERPTAVELGEELRRAQARHGFPVDEMALPAEMEREKVRQTEDGPPFPGPLNAGPSSAKTLGLGADLPLELTSFVGRRPELGEAKRLLSISRLVTLTGPGGVGKTRLAMRVASRARRDFPDGVLFIELGQMRDERLLVDVIAAALRLHDQPSTPMRATLTEFLDAGNYLLVLDNCEQMLSAVAEFVEGLLQACSGLRILVTSREPLDVGGEAILRVQPLRVPAPDREPTLRGLPGYDAVTLFVERATAGVPTFVLTDGNREAVSHICQKLDGLPLAIELAAARLRAMSPQQILHRLTDRFALLTHGSRGLPSRQRTLLLCIDWSYEFCDERERHFWAQASVFSGGFELDAAEGICGGNLPPEKMIDVVCSLVDKSILVREETGDVIRFRMLETIRDYGREKAVQSGEYDELRRRHRDWYRTLVIDAEAGWISSQQLAWIVRFKSEQPNLREAMEYCLSRDTEDVDIGMEIAAPLLLLWASRGLLSESRQWLDRFLAVRTADRPNISTVKALYAASVLAGWQGDLQSASILVQRGRALSARMDDPMANALVTQAEGLLSLFTGELATACSLIEMALTVFREADALTLHVEALTMLGLARDMLDGNPTHADDCYEEVLSITDSHGEFAYRSYTLWSMGVAQWRRGNPSKATSFLDQSLRVMRDIDDPVGVAYCLEALAWIAGSEGNPRRASVLMGSAQSLGRAVGIPPVFIPNLLGYHEECTSIVRQALGDPRYEAAQKEGCALQLDAAISYALGEKVAHTVSTSSASASGKLTKREIEVGELVSQGLTNKEIATRLVIAQRTAQGHVENILTKLGFTSRAQIAAWMVENMQSRPGGPK